jgi:hypothetical protein
MEPDYDCRKRLGNAEHRSPSCLLNKVMLAWEQVSIED